MGDEYFEFRGKRFKLNWPYGGGSGTAYYTYFERRDKKIIMHELVGLEDVERDVSVLPGDTSLEALIPVNDPEMDIRILKSKANFLKKAMNLEGEAEAGP